MVAVVGHGQIVLPVGLIDSQVKLVHLLSSFAGQSSLHLCRLSCLKQLTLHLVNVRFVLILYPLGNKVDANLNLVVFPLARFNTNSKRNRELAIRSLVCGIDLVLIGVE